MRVIYKEMNLMSNSTTKSRRHRRARYRRRLVPVQPNRFAIKSLTSDGDARYDVSVSPAGVVTCTCKSAQFRAGVLCSHGRRALAYQQRHNTQPEASPTLPVARLAPIVCHRCGSTDDAEYGPDHLDYRLICGTCSAVMNDGPDFEEACQL